MRKFSYKAPDSQETIIARPELSLEEQAIEIDEVAQQDAELEQASNDIDQLGDIIVTMGDVQTVVSNTPEIGTIEQALVSSVADAAVAGTDAAPEELVSGMLPTEGVSAESLAADIKDRVAKIWASIKAFFAKMWQSVKNFFTSSKAQGDKLKEKTEKVEQTYSSLDWDQVMKDIEANMRGKQQALPFEFRGRGQLLCLGESNTMVKPHDLSKHLAEVNRLGQRVVYDLMNEITDLLETLNRLIELCLSSPDRMMEAFENTVVMYNRQANVIETKTKDLPNNLLGDLKLLGRGMLGLERDRTGASLQGPLVSVSVRNLSHVEGKQELASDYDAANIGIVAKEWADFLSNGVAGHNVNKLEQLVKKLEAGIEKLIQHRPTDGEMTTQGLREDDYAGMKQTFSNRRKDTLILNIANEVRLNARLATSITTKLLVSITDIMAAAVSYCDQSAHYAAEYGSGPVKDIN
jgi:hypothetical protein